MPVIAAFLVKNVKYTGGFENVEHDNASIQAQSSRYPSYTRPSADTIAKDPLAVDQTEPADNIG